MDPLASYFSVIFAFVALFIVYKTVVRIKFTRAVKRPFPNAWRKILNDRLEVYHRLSNEQQQSLHSLILYFLYTKEFVGCAGLEITDDVRVIIAAEACLLILGRPSTRYKSLRWIYVYPSTFIARQSSKDEYGVVSEGGAHLLGVSWSNGKVVLAWDSVERGIDNFGDGQNVVLHEFAHQLDQEDGQADGAPLLYTKDAYHIWSRVLSKEFEKLVRARQHGQPSFIDQYGATNPAEFFAVVTEAYFERPTALFKKHPELFAVLKDYYKNDPRSWKDS